MKEQEIIEYMKELSILSDDLIIDKKIKLLHIKDIYLVSGRIKYWVNKLTLIDMVIESRGIRDETRD